MSKFILDASLVEWNGNRGKIKKISACKACENLYISSTWRVTLELVNPSSGISREFRYTTMDGEAGVVIYQCLEYGLVLELI